MDIDNEYQFFYLFPHKIKTRNNLYKKQQKIKDTLKPQKIDGYTALQLQYKNNVYPVSEKDCEKLHEAYNYDILKSEYSREDRESYETSISVIYFFLIVELSAILITSLLCMTYYNNTIVSLICAIISFFTILHGIILVFKMKSTRNDYLLDTFINSRQAALTIEAIIDTKNILNTQLQYDEDDDAQLFYELPKIVIEDRYQYDEEISNLVGKTNDDISYNDVIQCLTNNNVFYSQLQDFLNSETKTQPHVRMVPGLNDHIKNNVFNKSMSNNVFPERVMKYNTYFNLYSDLYFTLIQKISHYIDEYPQYIENRDYYNNLRLLLTVASLKELNTISRDVRGVSLFNKNFDNSRDKELESTFRINIMNEKH